MRFRAVAVALCALLTAGGASGLTAATAGASADPLFGNQWNLARIGAERGWTATSGGGIRIGVVDTGVDLGHEDLAGKVVAHTACLGTGGDPGLCTGSAQDEHGHGTHVSGIAAAHRDNRRGIAGVAPHAELVVVKVLDGSGTGSEDDVIAGVKWAVDQGARVVNLSLGDPNFVFTSLFGTSLREGIDYAWSRGAIPVLASGNTQLLGLGSSNYGDVNAVVVGATGPDDAVAGYSSPLGNAKWPILAPGGAGDGTAENNVVSAWWDPSEPNTYRALAGTSMAAPHVSGALALLLAQGYSPEGAVARLLATADHRVPCDTQVPCGRLDIAAATAR